MGNIVANEDNEDLILEALGIIANISFPNLNYYRLYTQYNLDKVLMKNLQLG